MGEFMAVNMVMTKKIGAEQLVKTVVSYGWIIRTAIKSRSTRVNNESSVDIYVIEASTKMGRFMINYQPGMNQLTVVGRNEQLEHELLRLLVDVFSNDKLGPFADKADFYKAGIKGNSMYIPRDTEDKELIDIINEVEYDMMPYIS